MVVQVEPAIRELEGLIYICRDNIETGGFLNPREIEKRLSKCLALLRE